MAKNIKMSQSEVDAYYEAGNEGVSDLDYAYNRESGKWDIPSIEWDGWYGTHWSRYESEEARTKALDKHVKDMNAWVLNYREVKVAEKAAKKEEIKRIANLGTLGGQFPEIWAMCNN